MSTTSVSAPIDGSVVAVVGGAGFLGSHLVDYLVCDKRCRVWVVDNFISGKRKYIHKNAEYVNLDITGPEQLLHNFFKQIGVNYVFNYAAMPYVPDSFKRPLKVFDINAFGALKVINAAHEAGAKGILQISSAEIYGNEPATSEEGVIPMNEDYPARPHSSYGASKLAIDSLVQCRWKEAKVPVISLRQFNCVGARETHAYIVPELISQCWRQIKTLPYGRDSSGKPRLIISLGNNTSRDFLCATDQVVMATELLEKGQFGEVYNLGSESHISIYELAYLVADIMARQLGANLPDVTIVKDPNKVRPWDIWTLKSDNSKIYSIISARPKGSLCDGIKAAIGHFISNGGCWDFTGLDY